MIQRDSLGRIGRPGLETILYIIDPCPTRSTVEKIAQMRQYAPELLELAGQQEIRLHMVSFLPDHNRIVLEVKDAQTAQKLYSAFSTSEGYEVRDTLIPGDREIRAKSGAYKNIHVKIGLARVVSLC